MWSSINYIWKTIYIILLIKRYRAFFLPKYTRFYALIKFIYWLIPVPATPEINGLDKNQRLVKLMEKIGPVTIKVGQILSVRHDLVGDVLGKELSKLQDSVKETPFEEIKKIIEDNIEQPLENVFVEFDPYPKASASIAQVHFAKTVDGKKVAVKVLHPHVKAQFMDDLDYLLWGARIIDALLPNVERFRLQEVLISIQQDVKTELNLLMEAAAANEMQEKLSEYDYLQGKVLIPEIYWDLCTPDMLTTERLENFARIDNVEQIKVWDLDVNDVLDTSSKLFFTMIYRIGFFHADLHPGNLLVLRDGRIALIDFGICGRLDLKTRQYLGQMLLGFLDRDYYHVAEVHYKAGWIDKTVNLDLFAQAIRSINEPIIGKDQDEISIAALLGQMLEVTAIFKMRAQPELVQLQKTMLVAEGVGQLLNPKMNIWNITKPLVDEWVDTTFSIPNTLQRKNQEALDYIAKLPKILDNIEEISYDMLHNKKDNEPKPQTANFIIAFLLGVVITLLLK